MSKTLVLTEKKSVAEDFARVLKGFKKDDQSYERDDMVIAWASGHLLELKGPAAYDEKYKRWALADLPILPKKFEHTPRTGDKKSEVLLKGLVRQLVRKDVDKVVNACDAGREGELIFNLILDHAGVRATKPVTRLWLQSMTSRAIEAAFDELKATGGTGDAGTAVAKQADAKKHRSVFPSSAFRGLSDAAYARDEADWLVGMNGTRAFTKRFMGQAKQFFAVGRVKTPTLAFLVDREREIDAFTPVPYFQLDATFGGAALPYTGRWSGAGPDGKKTDRFATHAEAQAVENAVRGQTGIAEDRETTRKEEPPLLFDLTSLQREASSRFGYTLDRTLSLVQSLYEQKKAVTYPRTSSRYLPNDYMAEVPAIIRALCNGPLAHVANQVPLDAKPETHIRVFNDAKVSDHFALIPTGEVPQNMRDDETRIYEMITRRFLAVFLPSALWLQVTRETTVAGHVFATRGRRLGKPGWRQVEPANEDDPLPALPAGGAATVEATDLASKETQGPARYTDGSLVKAMETAGRDQEHGDALDEETLEEIKEKGIGTAATRASIVKDLINKGLSRREGRSILPTPLGCTLVRIVRNLDLGALAKPDLTGEWEYRLARLTKGDVTRAEFDRDLRKFVTEMIEKLRPADETPQAPKVKLPRRKKGDPPPPKVFRRGGNEDIFARDHGGPMVCPKCGKAMVEKTFSYMCVGKDVDCDVNISKDQNGKCVFPETMRRLLIEKRVGPLTGFARTRAAGYLILTPEHDVVVELVTGGVDDPADQLDDGDQRKYETVPEGTVMGHCPKCKAEVTRQGSGYKCVRNLPRAKVKDCDYRLAEKIKYRWIPPADVRKLLSGQKTDMLFGFVSMRGMKFKASLYYDEKGELKWEFPPRAERKKKAKDGKVSDGVAATDAAAADGVDGGVAVAAGSDAPIGVPAAAVDPAAKPARRTTRGRKKSS